MLREDVDQINFVGHGARKPDVSGLRLRQCQVRIRSTGRKNGAPGLIPSFFASGVPEYPAMSVQNVSARDTTASATNKTAHMRYVTRAQRAGAAPSVRSTITASTTAQTTDASMNPTKNAA